MHPSEAEEPDQRAPEPGIRQLLPSREFLLSRQGLPLVVEAVLSFIIFICFIASKASAFFIVPLLTFLLALFFFFAYSLKLYKKFKETYWLLVHFLCCLVSAIIYFAISIATVSKYFDGGAKAAGVLGFVATLVYALDFYRIFNNLVASLKQSDPSEAAEQRRSEEEASDSDSD
uniref:Uncharacterized protein n=2 Tax=Sphaerodactylus townsendi TaxID=933632 RepID=A0ACB8E9M9_9SAUR